jgi:hypothetical protein
MIHDYLLFCEYWREMAAPTCLVIALASTAVAADAKPTA